MPTFLFWNLNRRPLAYRVARLAAAHAVDVVILAECVTDSAAMIAALGGSFEPVPGAVGGLSLFTRLPLSVWTHIGIDLRLERWTCYELQLPDAPILSLFAVHLPSKLRSSEQDQRLAARRLLADIGSVETQNGHRQTIVVGDLNMNPFEEGVAGAEYLHAVMTRATAAAESRTVQGQKSHLFYNPMWGVFGDRTDGPPGTYYRASGSAVNYFWNTYDQVLLRPAVMNHLAGLRVLDSDGTDSLLDARSVPDGVNGSDHLPVVFRMGW